MADWMTPADVLFFAEIDAQAAFDRAVEARDAGKGTQDAVNAAYDALMVAQDANRAVLLSA